jgi:hypothetical protein
MDELLSVADPARETRGLEGEREPLVACVGRGDRGAPAVERIERASTPLPAGFVTDTVSSARAAHTQAVLRMTLPRHFVTDTVLSARRQQLS